MLIKQVGKIILGADLNPKEQKALDIEIKKAMAEYDRKNCNEIDAMILWILFNEFDFTGDDLFKFHSIFVPSLDALCDRYEMGDEDCAWLCTKKLLDHGVDIEKWNDAISNDKLGG